MRILTTAAALLAATALLTAPLAAQAPAKASDPDKAVAGGGTLPAGWSARADRNAGLENVKVAPMGDGLHVTLGPAVILWRAQDNATKDFHTLATFTQTKAPTHPEGYGLFFGGEDLDGADQEYTYFLVRGDGTYLIKRRDGAETSNVSSGWTASPAVQKADSAGKATNKLEIDNKSNPAKVRFLVNGQEVYAADAKDMDRLGIVGLRVNHNLDVHVAGFALHQ